MVATTLNGVLLTGDHASRPAASAVAKGTLYACSTHSLIYQSDASSWTTWATLGSAASGSITSSGYTQSTAKLLGRSTASTGAIEEITVGTGLSLAAGSLTATGGGGGLAQSFLGYNTIGGTWNTMVGNSHYYKSITLGANDILLGIEAYLRPSTDNTDGLVFELANDNSGAPGVLVGASVIASPELYLSNSGSMPGAGRWFGAALVKSPGAGTYWIGVGSASTRFDLASDGSGSDQTFTASIFAATGGYPSAWAITTGTKKYSIRASILA